MCNKPLTALFKPVTNNAVNYNTCGLNNLKVMHDLDLTGRSLCIKPDVYVRETNCSRQNAFVRHLLHETFISCFSYWLSQKRNCSTHCPFQGRELVSKIPSEWYHLGKDTQGSEVLRPYDGLSIKRNSYPGRISHSFCPSIFIHKSFEDYKL